MALPTCHRCRIVVAKGASHCPQCGSKLLPRACPQCGRPIANNAGRCPECGAKVWHIFGSSGVPNGVQRVRGEIPRWLGYSVVLGGLILIAILMGKAEDESSDRLPAHVGEIAVLDSRFDGPIPMTYSKSDNNRLTQLAAANDTAGMQQMIMAGRMILLPEGTRVRVIGIAGLSLREVRVVGGEFDGVSGFVVENCLRATP